MSQSFEQIVASDVIRDTLSLELWDGKEQIAEIAYSDTTHKMTVSVWRQDMPLEIIEEMIEYAKRRLPPTGR
jgi:hypothetical protein